MRRLNLNRRRWITKNASDQCGVNKTLHSWKMRDSPKCPRCNYFDEDTTHVLCCLGRDASSIWNSNITRLQTTLNDLETQPDITDTIVTRLNQWRSTQGSRILPDIPCPPEIRTCIEQQDTIGWKNFLEGLPAKSWQLTQAAYYDSIGSPRNSKRWIMSLLQLLHNMAWDMWDHRNDIFHRKDKTLLHSHLAKLRLEIMYEYSIGTSSLPSQDHRHFHLPLFSILSKPLDYQQRWLLNLQAARDRQIVREQQQRDDIQRSQQRSIVLNWIRSKQPTTHQ
jgi:hypothetical protein